MAEPFIGEIRILAGSRLPAGWLFCLGQELDVEDYPALYSIIGSIYGQPTRPNVTFKLPNLQVQAPMGQGRGPGLTPRTIGQRAGASMVLLNENQIPAHTHTAQATNATGNSSDPTGRIWAKNSAKPVVQPYGKTVDAQPAAMNPNALGKTGGSQAHYNMQPYQAINFMIAYEGIYPVKP